MESKSLPLNPSSKSSDPSDHPAVSSSSTELLSVSSNEKNRDDKDNLKTEEYVRCLFENYSSEVDVWNFYDIRRFLYDYLFLKYDYPLFAPDEIINIVINELQLNSKNENITWVEFKSYFLYLHQDPLKDLITAISLKMPTAALNNSAVLISGLSITDDYSMDNFLALVKDLEPISKVYLHKSSGQAIVITQHFNLDTIAVLNGQLFCSLPITAQAYNGAAFPKLDAPGVKKLHPWLDYTTSMFAKVSVLIEDFDKKNKISETLARNYVQAADYSSKVDREYEISQKAHNAYEKTSEYAKKVDQEYAISATLAKKDEEYKVTENLNKAKEAVLANATVQSSLSYLGSVWGSVNSTFQQVKADAEVKIAQERAKTGNTAEPGSK